MKISVVIPAFNEEEYIQKCILSLQKQTKPAFEIIVVDNNCSDNTTAIATALGAKIITEEHQGIWPAAAAGYNAARGDIIARCDADSVMPKDWLAKLDESLQKNIAVTGPGKFYDTYYVVSKLADWLYMKAYFQSIGLALGQKPVFGSNFAMTKSTWMKVRNNVHSNRTDIHDDIDLSYHLADYGTICYKPNLEVQISARPFKSPRGMLKRYILGFRTIYLHMDRQSPWQIYRAKLHNRKV